MQVVYFNSFWHGSTRGKIFMGSFENRMDDYIDKVDNYLDSALTKTTIPPVKLQEAMHYALMNGGKRIRPLLV